MTRSDDQRKAMFANMANPSSKKKSKQLRRAKRGSVLRRAKRGSVSSSTSKLPRRLPIVTVQGVKYFQDDRLKEFRAVDNPHKRISFKDISDAGDWMDSIHPKDDKRLYILSEEIKAKQREMVERKTKTAKLTAKEDKSWVKCFEYHKSLGLSDAKADKATYKDMVELYPRLAGYDKFSATSSPDLLEKESKRIDVMIKRKQSKEPLEGVRKHRLMPVELRKKITKLYSKEGVKDPVVHTRFFSPYSSYNLLVTEFDGKDILYGYVSGVSEGGDEWGYSSLNEIAKAEKRGFPGLNWVERDKYFKPKQFSETDIGKALRKTESSPVPVKSDAEKIARNFRKRERERVISSLIGRQDFDTMQLKFWITPYRDRLKIVKVKKPDRWSGTWRTLYMIKAKTKLDPKKSKGGT